jgi:hypothetical protein
MDLGQMKKRCPNSELTSCVAEARGWKLCFPRESIIGKAVSEALARSSLHLGDIDQCNRDTA